MGSIADSIYVLLILRHQIEKIRAGTVNKSKIGRPAERMTRITGLDAA
jgi:hypothetical protein